MHLSDAQEAAKMKVFGEFLNSVSFVDEPLPHAGLGGAGELTVLGTLAESAHAAAMSLFASLDELILHLANERSVCMHHHS